VTVCVVLFIEDEKSGDSGDAGNWGMAGRWELLYLSFPFLECTSHPGDFDGCHSIAKTSRL